MNRRTKVVVYLITAAVVILAVIAGIGFRQGWFAGLADVIQSSGPTMEVKVEKAFVDANGQIINRVAFSGISVLAAPGPYRGETKKCRDGIDDQEANSASYDGSYQPAKGTSDGSGLAVLHLNPVEPTTYYIRLERLSPTPRLNSCAFTLEMGSWNAGDPDDVFGAQVWKIESVTKSSKKLTATFLYTDRGRDGAQPSEGGKITGKVLDKDDKVISDFGPNVFLIKNGVQTATTIPNSQTGEFTFDNLDAGKYTVRAFKQCYYDEVKKEDIAVVVKSTNDLGILRLSPGGLGYGRGKIGGAVLDGSTDKPLEGVLVTVGDSALNQDQTDKNGYYSICPVVVGNDLKITYGKDGFQTKTLPNINLQDGEDKMLATIKLEPRKVVSTFTIKGSAILQDKPLYYYEGIEVFVMDSKTDPDSNVKTEEGSNLFDQTDRTGLFEIKDVPVPTSPDDYYLLTRKAGYADKLKKFSYTGGAGGSIDMISDPIILYPSDISIFSGSISGAVVNNKGFGLEGAEVWVERFDGKKDKVATTDKDGRYKNDKLSADYIGEEVRVFAKYQSEEKKFTAYHNPEWFTTTRDNPNINIQFQEIIPKKRNITVRVVDEAGVNIPNANVAFVRIVDGFPQNLSINAKTTANGDPVILVITEPLEQGDYGFVASADNYTFILAEKQYKENEIPDQVTLVLKRSNPLIVDYYFEFWHKPNKQYSDDLLKKVIKIILSPIRDSEKEQIYKFIKINLGALGDNQIVFDKTLWSISHNFVLPSELAGKIDPMKDIIWYGPGFESGEANIDNIYRVTVTFPDEETKNQYADRIFANPQKPDNNLEFLINPKGMEGWVKYASYKLKKSDFRKNNKFGDNSYKIKVIFEFEPIAQDISEAVIVSLDQIIIPNEYEINSNIDAGQAIIDKDLDKIKIEKDKSGDAGDATSAQTIKMVEAINGILMFNLPAGKYKAVLDSGAYRLDERRNSFTIESGSKITYLTFGTCYSENARRKTYNVNLGLDILELGRWQLDSSRIFEFGAKRAESVLDVAKRGGLSAVVNLSDVSATSFYAKNGIKYCVENKDENYSGGIIAVSDSMIEKDKTRYADKISSLVSYQAGGIIYDNVLTDANRNTWQKISSAVDSLDNPENIYNLVFENSQLKDLDITIRDNLIQNRKDFYSVTLAAYKQNGVILSQRIDQLTNEEEKNIAKALTRLVIETAEPNPGDNNLYEPIAKISEMQYSLAVYKSGNWLKENYKNLNTRQKIRIKYLGLLSKISGNRSTAYIKRQIRAFNNWLDRMRGLGDNGTVNGVVIENGQPVASALVTINEKVAVTNKKGEFKIKKVQVGKHQISVKDSQSSQNYDLQNPNQQVAVQKNKESSIKIRVITKE